MQPIKQGAGPFGRTVWRRRMDCRVTRLLARPAMTKGRRARRGSVFARSERAVSRTRFTLRSATLRGHQSFARPHNPPRTRLPPHTAVPRSLLRSERAVSRTLLTLRCATSWVRLILRNAAPRGHQSSRTAVPCALLTIGGAIASARGISNQNHIGDKLPCQVPPWGQGHLLTNPNLK